MSRSGARSPSGRRVLRWALWLSGGIVVGLIAGFLAGLSRPRVNRPVTDNGDAGGWESRS